MHSHRGKIKSGVYWGGNRELFPLREICFKLAASGAVGAEGHESEACGCLGGISSMSVAMSASPSTLWVVLAVPV